MGSEEYMYDMDNDQMVVKDDGNPYWERVHDVGDGGVVFGKTEIPSTEVLPHPGGRSARILKRILLENRDFIEYVRHSMIFDVEDSAADSRSVILHADVPLSGSEKPVSGCSVNIEHAYETIINRFFEKGEILKFYCAVDQALQEVAHMSMPDVRAEIGDLSLTDPMSKPTDRELMETIAESGIHHGSNIRSFDESNYTNESSETNDNSPPDEHIVDIEYDASEIDDEDDFETRMYKVSNQTEDTDYIGEVVEYNPDMNDESVEIVVRCPDQSIGLLEYNFPETESASNSEFVSMINCARETKLVADDEGNIEQTYAEITLDSIERLKNAEIPLKEHKDTWVVATSNELDTDNKTVEIEESELRIDYKWFASELIDFSRATFWTVCIPSIILFYPGDQYETFGEFRKDVESTVWKLWTMLGVSLLAWVTTYATVF